MTPELSTKKTPADIYYERRERQAEPTGGERERLAHLISLVRKFEKAGVSGNNWFLNVIEDRLLVGEKFVNTADPLLASGEVTLRELELRVAISHAMKLMNEYGIR